MSYTFTFPFSFYNAELQFEVLILLTNFHFCIFKLVTFNDSGYRLFIGQSIPDCYTFAFIACTQCWVVLTQNWVKCGQTQMLV